MRIKHVFLIMVCFLICGCNSYDIYEGLDYPGQFNIFYRAYGSGNHRDFYKLTKITEEEYKSYLRIEQ